MLVMKSLFFSVFATGLLLLSANVFARNKMIETQAKLQGVTVYLNAAELTHQGRVELPSGTSTLVVTNLSPLAQEETVQVAFEREGVKILSSQFSVENLSLEELASFNPAAQEALVEYKALLEKSNVLQVEKKALEKVLGGLGMHADATIDAVQGNTQKLEDLLQFTYEKQKSYELKLSKVNEEFQLVELKLQRSRERLQELGIRIGQKYSQGRVILSLQTESALNTGVYVRYLAFNAQWRHSYEIRGEASEKPLKLVSRATIAQNTGLSWESIKLRLVYSYAQVYQEAPKLLPWTLYGQSQQQKMSMLKAGAAPVRMRAMASNRFDEDVAPVMENMERSVDEAFEDRVLGAGDVEVSSGMLNLAYDINIPYNVLSNGRDHQIEIQEIELPAQYSYFAIPKLNAQAYLVATIKDYNRYGLLASEASVVFEKMRSGTTFLTPTNQTNELPITLGVEPRIAIERKVVTDKSSDVFLSSNRERVFTYDILVRNNKKVAVNLTLKDQYPLSAEENVKIELLESSGAVVNSTKGELSWELKLEAGEAKTLRLSYKVRYPKNVELNF